MENGEREVLLDSEVNLDAYYELIKNLAVNDKLKLITIISNSLIKDENKNKINSIISCFEAFESEESADEIIKDLYKSRKFIKKDIDLRAYIC